MGKYITPEDYRIDTQFRDLSKRVQKQARAARSENTSITRGNYNVRGGANINVSEGGGINVSGGGGLSVRDGGSITVPGGGDVEVSGGGVFRNVHNLDVRNTREAILFAGQLLLRPDGFDGNRGRLLAAYAGEGNPVCILVPPNNVSTGPLTDEIEEETNYIYTMGQNDDFPGHAAIASHGEVDIFSDESRVFIEHETTSATANCNITTRGQIRRTTSSIRYKQDIQDLDIDINKVLALTPRSWRDKTEAALDPDTTNRHVGLIAEELESIGLTQFIDYNENGEPEHVTYDRLVVALVSVLKEQQKAIQELSNRVDAMFGEPTKSSEPTFTTMMSGPVKASNDFESPPEPPKRVETGNQRPRRVGTVQVNRSSSPTIGG